MSHLVPASLEEFLGREIGSPEAPLGEACPSAYGKGLCYCLGLFLSHVGLYIELDRLGLPEDMLVARWFKGASDHLRELQIDAAPPGLRKRLSRFRAACIAAGSASVDRGRGKSATRFDVAEAIQEAKDLLRVIDAANGVPTEKGAWE